MQTDMGTAPCRWPRHPPTLLSLPTSAGRVLRSSPGAPSGEQRCCKSGWAGAGGFLGPGWPCQPVASGKLCAGLSQCCPACQLVLAGWPWGCGGPRDSWPEAPGPRTHTVLREVWLAREGGRESGGLRGPRGVHPIFNPQKVTQTANKRTWRSTPSPALTRAPLEGLPGVQLPQDACFCCPQPRIWAAAREF